MKILCTWNYEGHYSKGKEGSGCRNEATRFFRFFTPEIYQAVCPYHVEKHKVDFHYREITMEEYVIWGIMES